MQLITEVFRAAAPRLPRACCAVAFLTGLAAGPAWAQGRTHAARPGPRAAGAPKSIGKFEEWQAATHSEAGQMVCYAFTRASSSAPALPGRGDVVLTVTQRPSGRDAVALSAGFAYARGVDAVLTADKAELPFYTAERSAFARDGHAVVQAFDRARIAVVRSPGPRGTPVSDTFSLRGFTAAYAAINKACPAK